MFIQYTCFIHGRACVCVRACVVLNYSCLEFECLHYNVDTKVKCTTCSCCAHTFIVCSSLFHSEARASTKTRSLRLIHIITFILLRNEFQTSRQNFFVLGLCRRHHRVREHLALDWVSAALDTLK